MQFPGSPPPERRIVRLVGSGGMGVVYEAWDTRLDRRVALKVLHGHITAQGEMRDRLLKEARLAAKLEHEGVVRIYAIHEIDGGLCLEMQFVEGLPLNRLLANRPISPVQAADLLRQILEALMACHAQHVVHCDLKPGNLLVTPEGKVLLTDFGISRAVYPDGQAKTTIATLSGPMWGTPQYSPPEAWEGASPAPNWDLYALGVIIHEGLSGSLPFEAQTPAMLMREKLDGSYTPIRNKRSDISPELSALIDSLQAKDVQDRPDSAECARELLGRAPEFKSEAMATKPFRHNEDSCHQDASARDIPVSINAPVSLYAQEDTPNSPFSWKIHASWLVAFTILAALLYETLSPDKHKTVIDDGPINPAVGNPGEVRDLFTDRENAFFSYDDGRRGRELWMADRSTGRVRIVADIDSGPSSSNPGNFLLRGNGGFLFTATTPEHGEEPWLCGVAPAFPTRIVKDVIPGPMSSNPKAVAASGVLSLFYATTLEGSIQPWITNASREQTGMLNALHPNKLGGVPAESSRVIVDASRAFFVQGAVDKGLYLWQYDFQDGILLKLSSVNHPLGGDMALFGNDIIFAMKDPAYGFELWICSAEGGEARLLKDIWPGPESSDPMELFNWKDSLYFRARHPEHGTELWKTDGTSIGTVEVADIYPGPGDSGPYNFVATQSHLFFRAMNLSYGDELWVTDGESGSTPQVFNVAPGREGAHPYSVAPIGKYLFFSANDGVHGEELWALELANLERPPFLVQDIRPGLESSEPHSLISTLNNTGIFIYKTGNGDGLMKIDAGHPELLLTPYAGLAFDDGERE